MPDLQPEASPETKLDALLIPITRVSELLSISTRTLSRLNSTAQIPAPVRLGGRLLWNVRILEEWVAAGCPPRHRWEAMAATPATVKQRVRH